MFRHTHRHVAIGLVGMVGVLLASFAVVTSAASASVVSTVVVTPSTLVEGTAVSYQVNFNASTGGALVAGTGTITLVAPATTVLPLLPAEYTVNGTPVVITPRRQRPTT